MNKKEVNEILKFGAEDLFKDDKEAESKVVTYDEEAVRKMLDRSQEVKKEVEKSFGMNEYLRSFKVATYKVKEVDEKEEEEEEEEEVVEELTKPELGADDKPDETPSEYWQRVLGDSYADHMQQLEIEQAEIQKSLGKGKRIRKRINYAETALMEQLSQKKKMVNQNVEVLAEDADHDKEYFSDFNPEEVSSESEGDDDDDDDDKEDGDFEDRACLTAEERMIADKKKKEKLEQERKREQKELLEKRRKEYEKGQQAKMAAETLPPLLAKVNNNIEVLGFTPRQRRVFQESVMRFGLPADDSYQSQWLVRDLRGKSERVFKAYVSMFTRHLCEPVDSKAIKFSDGVPVEGLSREYVLTRIGIIALIKRKVLEYEKRNGADSLEELFRASQKILTKRKLEADERHKNQVDLLSLAAKERALVSLLKPQPTVTPRDGTSSETVTQSSAGPILDYNQIVSNVVKAITSNNVKKPDSIVTDSTSTTKVDLNQSEDYALDPNTGDIITKNDKQNSEKNDNVSKENDEVSKENDEVSKESDEVSKESNEVSKNNDEVSKENDEKENVEASKEADDISNEKNDEVTADDNLAADDNQAAEADDTVKNSGIDTNKESSSPSNNVDNDNLKDGDNTAIESKPDEQSIVDDMSVDVAGSKVDETGDHVKNDAQQEVKDKQTISQVDGAGDEKGEEEESQAKPSSSGDEESTPSHVASTSQSSDVTSEITTAEESSDVTIEKPAEPTTSLVVDTAKADTELDDTGKDDTGKEDTGKDETEQQHGDTGKDDTGKDDTGKEDTGKDDTGKDETEQQHDDTGKDDAVEAMDTSVQGDANTEVTPSSADDDVAIVTSQDDDKEQQEVADEEMDTVEDENSNKADDAAAVKDSNDKEVVEINEDSNDSMTDSVTSIHSDDDDEEDIDRKHNIEIRNNYNADDSNSNSVTSSNDNNSDRRKVQLNFTSSVKTSSSPDDCEVIDLDLSETPKKSSKTNITKSDKTSAEGVNSTKESGDTIVIELSSTDSSAKVVKPKPKPKPKTELDLQNERLRPSIWIADGGFTELHAVWNHEEAMLVEGDEWTVWHRRHDFWLLAGVITHGYRHWQELLSDPRFDILNKAFRPDLEKMKKAAFLNRRFQLLEQAIIIEEQLRKAARDNKAHFNASEQELVEMGVEITDPMVKIDQFASNLRKISHGQKVRGPSADSSIHKAISGLSTMISDIRQITYKTMPSTLSMTDLGAHKPTVTKSQNKKVIRID